MPGCIVLCWALLALVAAEECPGGGKCGESQTCCEDPISGFECCPLEEGVCCDDHMHCCPAGTICNSGESSCVNMSISIPWVERTSADRPSPSKSFRMIKTYVGEEDENICPDQSRCPQEFSCLRASTRFRCCPITQGVPCADGKHCCPEDQRCSADSYSCIRREADEVTAATANHDATEKVPQVTTAGAVPPLREEAPVPKEVEGNDVKCNQTCSDGTTCCESKDGGWNCCPQPEDTQVGDVACDFATACPEGNTCCKTEDGRWSCCPLDQAVCCDDHVHCCPFDTTCEPATLTCLGLEGPTPMREKTPAFAAPAATTAAVPMVRPETRKADAETDEATTPPEEEEEEEDEVKGGNACDAHTSCPLRTTCCFIASSQEWGCCPLPEAVCCTDRDHCCPVHYKCDEGGMTCIKDGVVIPWYTKLPAAATTNTSSVQAEPSCVQCDAVNQCPESTTCCQLFTGEWGCCPLLNAVCCSDREHCCPQGYICNLDSRSCHKLITLQLETIPLTPVYLAEHRPSPVTRLDVRCQDQTTCKDGMTCCKMSATTWGCCPHPNAVCCSDMEHCCPTGYMCSEGGLCRQSTGREH